jgi:hypothetical protein
MIYLIMRLYPLRIQGLYIFILTLTNTSHYALLQSSHTSTVIQPTHILFNYCSYFSSK